MGGAQPRPEAKPCESHHRCDGAACRCVSGKPSDSDPGVPARELGDGRSPRHRSEECLAREPSLAHRPTGRHLAILFRRGEDASISARRSEHGPNLQWMLDGMRAPTSKVVATGGITALERSGLPVRCSPLARLGQFDVVRPRFRHSGCVLTSQADSLGLYTVQSNSGPPFTEAPTLSSQPIGGGGGL